MMAIKATIQGRRLELDVPPDWPDGTEVELRLLESNANGAPPMDREAWLRFIAEVGGSITDPTFVRHPEGETEEREPLSGVTCSMQTLAFNSCATELPRPSAEGMTTSPSSAGSGGHDAKA